jgi:hypothetical protein
MFKANSLLIVFFLLSATSLPAEVLITSPSTRVSLLEFYTSEGCSSCPPADRWISKLKSHPGLWSSLVPVAFHVDYWNYIGWQDRFSSPEYSARQRRYAHSKSLKTVYTPGFLMNGEEWRSFFGIKKLSTVSDQKVGMLSLKIDDMALTAEYNPVDAIKDKTLILNVAVLGFDIKTEVEAGENRNKELRHDFTVLGFKSVPLYKELSTYQVMTELPDIVETAPRMAISAWLNKENDMTPIQAVGGWLENKCC